MNKLFVCAFVLGGFALSTAPVQGDIPNPFPRPKPRTQKTVPFRVEVSDTAKNAKLIVPANHSNRVLRGGGDGAAAPPGARESSLKKTRTIFAGLAMSLAVGGFFFISRGAKTRNVVMVCIALGVTTSGATYVFGNLAPFDPPEPPGLPGVVGEVEVEIVPRGNEVVLVLPKKQRRDFLKNIRTSTANKNRGNKPPLPPGIGGEAPPAVPSGVAPREDDGAEAPPDLPGEDPFAPGEAKSVPPANTPPKGVK